MDKEKEKEIMKLEKLEKNQQEFLDKLKYLTGVNGEPFVSEEWVIKNIFGIDNK